MEGLIRAYKLVRAERVRGSSWALATLTRGVIEDLEAGRGLDCGRSVRLISEALPGSGALENLAWLVSRLCSERERLEGALRRLLDIVDRGAVEASSRAVSFIRGFDVAVTLSFSRAVSEALVAARPRRVIVLESLPGGEGVFAARHLRERGLRVELAPDSSAGRFLGEGSVVVFGADAAGVDGCVANKLGTLTLAAAAKVLGSRVVSIFETYKIVGRPICRGFVVEERSYTVEGWVKVKCPLLDVTPPELITVVVTERAVARPERGWLEALRNSFLEEVLEV